MAGIAGLVLFIALIPDTVANVRDGKAWAMAGDLLCLLLFLLCVLLIWLDLRLRKRQQPHLRAIQGALDDRHVYGTARRLHRPGQRHLISAVRVISADIYRIELADLPDVADSRHGYGNANFVVSTVRFVLIPGLGGDGIECLYGSVSVPW